MNKMERHVMANTLNRREFLRAACAGAAALPLAAMAQGAADGVRRPNIIFVMVDDMGYGDLGVYGQKHIRMPRVDQMAREGIRYTNVYAGSTVCAPSRSVLMTGQHTGHTWVRDNTTSVSGHGAVPCSGKGGGLRLPLRPEDVTVAELLQEAGYVTGITGKWGLGEPGTAGVPNLQGFDEWRGFLNQRIAHTFYPTHIWENQEERRLEGNTGPRADFVSEAQYVHDLFTDFALDFIRRHGKGDPPFFLYVPYTIPHSFFQIPELAPYTRDTGWTEQEKVYASMLTRADRDVGRMLDLLQEMGIDDNTIVFFCSDNGAANRYDGVFDSSGLLRGGKRDMYEGGLRTVMVARWPETIQAGAVSDDIWYFADVLPTFATLAGAATPGHVDGVSVLPSLLSQPQPELADRFLYWEYPDHGFQQAARRGKWKAVRQGPDAPIELYDLEADIGETKDLAAAHPDIVTMFQTYFREARTPSVHWPSSLDS
jgi:arylsulfatase A-like enzyme